MKWLNLAVTPYFSWPNVQVKFYFEDNLILLLPCEYDYEENRTLACSISVYDPNGLTFKAGGTIARRFLSCLAWSMNRGIVELLEYGSNNNMPGRIVQKEHERSNYSQVEPDDYIYLPEAKSQEAKLALGLFREGMCVNSAPFAFLSYFKILNILHHKGNKQKSWINDNLDHLWYKPALDRLDELRKSVPDIGRYLYEEGRCAIAHANGTPIVNPDRYEDKFRIKNDLILMKELSALYIEKELHVLTSNSFWTILRKTHSPVPELLKKTQNTEGYIVYIPA